MPFFRKYNREKKNKHTSQNQSSNILRSQLLSSVLFENISEIQSIFSQAPDLVVKNFVIKQTQSQASLVYLSGLTDKAAIQNHVLNPLLFEANKKFKDFDVQVSLGRVEQVTTWGDIESAILEGTSILFIEGRTKAYQCETQGWPQRGIEDTSIESSLRGWN
ncbi:spore germination protein [Neobacillus pocheonensis]|uniref:spore germination protein n=1 Tax=Neobacillus pocheonensis TaxID=363869 RepID=UPI003D2B395C